MSTQIVPPTSLTEEQMAAMAPADLIRHMGKSFEEFKRYHKQSLDSKDALIQESREKAAQDVAGLHETVQKQKQEIEELSTKLNRSFAFEDQTPEERKKARDERRLFQASRETAWKGKNHPNGPLQPVSVEDAQAYAKAFGSYMRLGDKALAGTQHEKTLTIGSDPDGGYWLMPPQMAGYVVTRMFETTPMRKLATVQPITSHSFRIPQDPNEFNAGWAAEMTPRTTSPTPNIAMKEIVAYEMYAEPPISQQLLEDSAIDVESWVGKKVADKLSRLENTSFVSGNGVTQPRGILTYPAGTGSTDVGGSNSNLWGQIQQIGTGSSGNFSYNGLLYLITSLKDKYEANAQFLIRRQAVAKIMLLQDGNGRYIFQPILNGNFNATPLLGYTINYAFDMPMPGAGSLSLAFGDFKEGYIVVDRIGISVLRDPFTAKPTILYYTRKRTGGDVQDFDAIKLQVLT